MCAKEGISRLEDFALFSTDELKALRFHPLNLKKILKAVADDESGKKQSLEVYREIYNDWCLHSESYPLSHS